MAFTSLVGFYPAPYHAGMWHKPVLMWWAGYEQTLKCAAGSINVLSLVEISLKNKAPPVPGDKSDAAEVDKSL